MEPSARGWTPKDLKPFFHKACIKTSNLKFSLSNHKPLFHKNQDYFFLSRFLSEIF